MWSTLGQLLRVRERGTKREEEEKNRQISFHCSLFLYTIASKTGAFSFLSPTEPGDRGHPFCMCVRLQSSHACATHQARLPCITPLWHAINQDKSQNPRGDGSFLHTAWLKSKIYEATMSVSMRGSWLCKRMQTHTSTHTQSVLIFLNCSKRSYSPMVLQQLLSVWSRSQSIIEVLKNPHYVFLHDHLCHTGFALLTVMRKGADQEGILMLIYFKTSMI